MGAKKIIAFLLAFLVAITFGAALAVYLGGGFSFAGEEPYYAVQMENGDLYFGKINRLPNFGLKDVYITQSVSDPTNPLGSSLRVIPLNQASIWKANEIQLNRDKVLSISKVDASSQMMQTIKGQ